MLIPPILEQWSNGKLEACWYCHHQHFVISYRERDGVISRGYYRKCEHPTCDCRLNDET